MTIFQILILLFILFVLYKATKRFIKKEITILLFIFWIVFWLAIAFVAVFPETINRLADLVGVGRGVDLLIYLAIIILFYAGFRIYIRLNKIEKNITEIVRKIALSKAKKGK